jgi:hypothetical protein
MFPDKKNDESWENAFQRYDKPNQKEEAAKKQEELQKKVYGAYRSLIEKTAPHARMILQTAEKLKGCGFSHAFDITQEDLKTESLFSIEQDEQPEGTVWFSIWDGSTQLEAGFGTDSFFIDAFQHQWADPVRFVFPYDLSGWEALSDMDRFLKPDSWTKHVVEPRGFFEDLAEVLPQAEELFFKREQQFIECAKSCMQPYLDLADAEQAEEMEHGE